MNKSTKEVEYCTKERQKKHGYVLGLERFISSTNCSIRTASRYAPVLVIHRWLGSSSTGHLIYSVSCRTKYKLLLGIKSIPRNMPPSPIPSNSTYTKPHWVQVDLSEIGWQSTQSRLFDLWRHLISDQTGGLDASPTVLMYRYLTVFRIRCFVYREVFSNGSFTVIVIVINELN